MEPPFIPQIEGEDIAINHVLARAGLQRQGRISSSLTDQVIQRGTSIIVTYLLDEVPEFLELAELRRQGWENPAGDRHFHKQRRAADKTDKQTSKYHYRLMQKIGEEIHNTTMGLATRTFPGTILDMCVAPGGFLATAKRLNPGAEVMGFSLPPSDGGYSVLLPEDKESCVRFLDITMLAADMGVTTLPEDHQDIGEFLPRQFKETQLFELVICDGQVLRTHTREPYREPREPTRLKTVQLALGLEHMKPGGTMLVLFHKLESWDTACYIRKFSEFSSVRLFKPRVGHATRSSFYMVASNVQSQHPKARLAVKKWKEVWRAATFGSEEDFMEAFCDAGPSAEKLLEEFGSKLVSHGREIWPVQAQALTGASFIKG
ncbi:hypothetical protein Forpi1262_v014342 [Fusarium oxysporum f. sp. raphani]|uniref:Ribosomal RNA methyltransferase FtsJ domain-containing protein n=1 Tax=Fusarium oxysporum f. sp. raphani TaxID=96318 RepID=A0A8J5PI60_FUSOX|nr:hypothetical protein Forpi1262_v014342 [Fusarium oxysporum f. sp. raphani]